MRRGKGRAESLIREWRVIDNLRLERGGENVGVEEEIWGDFNWGRMWGSMVSVIGELRRGKYNRGVLENGYDS